MKTKIFKFIAIAFVTLTVNNLYAQISYVSDLCKRDSSMRAKSNEQLIIASDYIIEGSAINSEMQNFIKNDRMDNLYTVCISHVLKGKEINIGDTVLVLLKDIATGNLDNYIRHPHSAYPNIWPENIFPTENAGLFLKKSDIRLKNPKYDQLQDKIYELYPTECGFATVRLSHNLISDKTFEVWALFGLKFKTKQDWYNYLKQYPDIKVPEVY